MSQGDTPLKLSADVPPEGRAPLARMLRQIVHDANTPISTIDMDTFSLRRAVDRLRASATSSAPDDAVARQLASIDGICANLERASSKLQAYFVELAEVADRVARVPDGASAEEQP